MPAKNDAFPGVQDDPRTGRSAGATMCARQERLPKTKSTNSSAKSMTGIQAAARSLNAFFTTRLPLFAPFLRDGLYLPTHRRNASVEATMAWLYLALSLGFFAAFAALIYGCERLQKR